MTADTTGSRLCAIPAARPDQYIREDAGLVYGEFLDLRIDSAFQPIFSVAHRRAVGFEALARMLGPDGTAVSPRDVFGRVCDEGDNILLDRLCRAVHTRNFVAQTDGMGWLFLNVDPHVTANGRSHGAFFAGMLENCGISPHRVVVEILERQVRDEAMLVEAAAYYRDLGCLVAIDDFGAGHSNFERIWRILPHIVKLDRSIVTQAAESPRVRRIVPSLVDVIHEAGSLVLMEGIETEQEAITALESDIDFVQGFHFARPAPQIGGLRNGADRLSELCARHNLTNRELAARNRRILHPYADAFEVLVKQFSAGADIGTACRGFLDLTGAERCYVLDKDGRQSGQSLLAPGYTLLLDARFEPVRDSRNATWRRRDYFRQARAHPGQIQVSRPYLSIAGGNMCVTLSASVFRNKEMVVLCGDLTWLD